MLNNTRLKRKNRMFSKNRGTGDKPRLNVFRSNQFIYAQLINDETGVTLAHAKGKKGEEVGEKIAAQAVAKKVSEIVFDRGGYKYHGNVKALADGARKGGLIF